MPAFLNGSAPGPDGVGETRSRVAERRPASAVGRMTRGLGLWGPVALYMALIFGLSSQQTLPEPPGGLTDKHEHYLAYAGLSTLACRAVSGGLTQVGAGGALGGWALASLYGLTDEYHQSFVPGRTSDAYDALADTAGAATAAVGLWAWGIIARSRRERRSAAPPA